ncbi:MAG TPA: protoporphyrinogen oxidase [Vicinamibacterales bacterium]|nr:protoporphyrinogen oxidase [Vicinamibacterales bacterium]
MTESSQVLILGGGIAGLAAAYELHQLGIPFTLLEAGTRVGGVVLSEEVDGFNVDGGPDALLIQKPDGIKLCQELGLGTRLVTTKLPRLAFIQRAGRLHALPAASVMGIPTEWAPFIRTSLFTWPGKIRMGMEMFVPKKPAGGDESIGAFMRRRFGNEAVDYLAEPLLAGIHAGNVDRLSIRALFPRFPETEQRFGSLLRAFRAQPRQPASRDGAFKSLPGGLSELIDAIERALPPASIRKRTAAVSVSFDGAAYVVESARGDVFKVRAVIAATPAFVAAKLLQPVAPAAARLCGDIPYASAATVAFAFTREQVRHPLNGSGFVVPRVENTGIMAGSWLSSKWPGRAPEGKVLLRTFLGGARDPAAFLKSDAEMIATGLSAMRPLLGITGDPLFTRVYRWENANAQHEVGHLDRLASLERELASHPGLFITGSGFRGVGIPDCVADARSTGRQVSAWLGSVVS